MNTVRHLSQLVATLPTTTVDGRYYRFTSRKRVATALDGSRRGGRWGPTNAFPVLYLTDDYEGSVIEAYRHATDAQLDHPSDPVNLVLVACDVSVTNVLDLRTPTARMTVGLDPAILSSEPQGPDGAAYTACSQVAQAAHQLGRHGILVPAATQRGHTLALFTDLLPADETAVRVGGVAAWRQLPADPRALRLITNDDAE